MDVLIQLRDALADRYVLEREVGAGGMATVYLARDVRHNRRVALKVLRPDLGAVLGSERFLSEIQVTANLQHPNLLPLFDSGEAAGLVFYVMPYVEGESLRARLDREKQLPVAEAVRIGIAVAGALDYAHRQNVIHRDLKPENILLHEGQPLVADFGIALAVTNAGGNRITQTGVSLGTPQYMSPEQATADRVIDRRTDIYSLGAVLYEMLAGEPPHTGSTAQAVIARVLTERPRSIRETRDTVPEHVERAIEIALTKLPADRWATAQEFAEALSGARTTARDADGARGFSGVTSVAGVSQRARRLQALVPWMIAVAATAAAAIAIGRLVRSPEREIAQRSRFTVVLSDTMPLRSERPQVTIALSPDGSMLAYVGGTSTPGLYLRGINELTPRRLPGTENALGPQFSPDARWLAFAVGDQVKKLPLSGGPAVVMADSVNPPRFAWSDRDVVVFNRGSKNVGPLAASISAGPLWRVNASGGRPEQLTHLDASRGETGHTWPRFLPASDAVLFEIHRGSVATSELAAARLADGKVVRLGIPGVNPQFVSSGHIVFGRLDGSIFAVPFDPRNLRLTGPPVPVMENVLVKIGGAVEVATSRNGTMAYVPTNAKLQLAVVDREGRSRRFGPPAQAYVGPRYSPDGKRVALQVDGAGTSDIWIADVASGTLSRLTGNGKSAKPEWTADGRRIAWNVSDSSGSNEYWQSSDGSGTPELLAAGAGATSMSPTGNFALINVLGGKIDKMMLDSTRRRTPLLAMSVREGAARVSPDGRWIAYTSNESGIVEVYVRPIEGAGGVHQISANGGNGPVWNPNGQEIFFRAGARLVAAAIATAPDFTVLRRDTLPIEGFAASPNTTDYDVTRDGKGFLMLKSSSEQFSPVIVFGWLDELRERLALAGKK